MVIMTVTEKSGCLPLAVFHGGAQEHAPIGLTADGAAAAVNLFHGQDGSPTAAPGTNSVVGRV